MTVVPLLALVWAAAPQGETCAPGELDTKDPAYQAAMKKSGEISLPPPPTPLPPFRWKLSNVVSNVEMPGTQEVDGVPVKLHGVYVKARPEEVIRELVGAFQAAGLYLDDKQDQPFRQLQVTAVDTDRGISYTALIQGYTNGQSFVVLGEAHLAMASLARLGQLNPQKNGTDFAPLMAGAEGVSRVRSEGMDSVTYSVQKPETEVLKYYQDSLPKLGFKQEGEWYRRGTDLVSLRTRKDGARTDVMLTRRQLGSEERLGP